jgi:hypothetical protein
MKKTFDEWWETNYFDTNGWRPKDLMRKVWEESRKNNNQPEVSNACKYCGCSVGHMANCKSLVFKK